MMTNKSIIRVITALVICLMLAPLKLFPQWKQVTSGIFGNYTGSLAVVNERIFAGTQGGVFVSNDNGNTWVQSGAELGGNSVNALIAVSNVLFLALNGGGTHFSLDNGQKWNSIRFPNGNAIVELTSIGNLVYALSNDYTLYSISIDGKEVKEINTGLNPISMAASANRLFLGTINNGLFQSSDGGINWLPVNLGITPKSVVPSISAVGSTILVWAGPTMLISTDNGSTWITTKISVGYSSLGIFGNKIFVGNHQGTYFSLDKGLNFAKISSLPEMRSFVSNSVGLFAGSGKGVFRSQDSGITWVMSNEGMTNSEIRKIVSLNNTLIAASQSRLFISTNEGASWNNTNLPFTNSGFISALIAKGSNIVVGSHNEGGYFSSDNGRTWNKIPSITSISCFAVLGNDLYCGTRDGIYLSKDDGVSWSAFSKAVKAAILHGTSTDLFAASFEGLFRLSAFGQVTQVQNGLPLTNDNQLNAFTSIRDRLFCGVDNAGVFTSADNGNSWTAINTGLTQSLLVSALAVSDNYLFVSRVSQGIHYTTTNGTSWTAFNEGFRESMLRFFNSTLSIAIVKDKIFAGTSSSGVWVNCIPQKQPEVTASGLNTLNPLLTSSSSDGNQWYLNGTAIPNATGSTLIPTLSGAYSVAVTSLGGCQSPRSVEQAVIITGDIVDHQSRENLIVFPNPVQRKLTVDLNLLSGNEPVQFEILDLNNHAIAKYELLDEKILEVDLSSFAGGFYLLRCKNGNETHVKRFVKLP